MANLFKRVFTKNLLNLIQNFFYIFYFIHNKIQLSPSDFFISSVNFVFAVLLSNMQGPRDNDLDVNSPHLLLCVIYPNKNLYLALFATTGENLALIQNYQSDVFSLFWLPRDDIVTGQRYKNFPLKIKNVKKNFLPGL